MKKVISTIIIMIILLMGIGMTNVQAASCRINVSTSNKTPKVGDKITVTISFSPAIGAASPVHLDYNKSVLKYVGSNMSNASNKGNYIQLDYIDLTMKNQTISSMSVTFQVIAEGTSTCKVSKAVVADATAAELTPSINSSATITVKKEEKPNTNTNTDGNTNTNTNTNSDSSSSGSNNNNKEPNFRNVNQKVYATSQVNIRKSWSTGSAQLGRLEKGDSITRTGIGDNGWSRVTYNGQTAYINSSYLTTTEPKDDDDEEDENNSVNNEETNDTNNTDANEQNNTTNEVTNNEEANNEANNEVGNLENAVGNNQVEEEKESPNYILYIIIAIIVIAIIVIIIASIRESKQNRKNRRK